MAISEIVWLITLMANQSLLIHNPKNKENKRNLLTEENLDVYVTGSNSKVKYPNKYYYTDIGFRNARLNYRQHDPGHIMENIIYNELLRKGYSVDVGVVTDRTGGANVQKEIDFVVNDADRKIYIHSAFQMDTDKKESSELASLILKMHRSPYSCVVFVATFW